ncbi:MAG: ribulose-phosphate 3-epimerase [Kiritimatiellaeota bacterium]|nr:ribulose-phosphate 3-epimerase [Kiritimatiellota bacterium]
MPHRIQPLTELPAADSVLVAPSLLAADFARLDREIRAAADGGADVLHLDIMDGHFVPNLSFGPPVVRAVRPVTSLPFDVHLMLAHPGAYVRPFVEAGADHITFHVEIEGNVRELLATVRETGCSVGLSLKPATPAAVLAPYLDQLDLVLVMTVEPGFGGQSFREDVAPKIRELRQMIDRGKRPVHLEVDGGIKPDTARTVLDAGANLLVAGTSVFRAPDGPGAAIRRLKEAGNAPAFSSPRE